MKAVGEDPMHLCDDPGSALCGCHAGEDDPFRRPPLDGDLLRLDVQS